MPKTRTYAAVLAALAIVLAVSSCDTLDNERIPVQPVNISFATVADWNVYGVSGALTWRSFVREERLPSNYPYTAMTYTGFGGVLLVGDVFGNPQAYDLACPFECSRTVRLFINTEAEHLAECPKCGSRFNVFSLTGHPVSGPAAERGYALRRYRVEPGRAGEYYIVRN